jgi:predicted nucleic acid-binding protein
MDKSGTFGILKTGYELCLIKDMQELKTIIQELQSVWFRMSSDLKGEILELKRSTICDGVESTFK